MPYSDIARQYLIEEGLNADRIIKTGSPMHEVLNYYENSIKSSKIIDLLKLKKNNYFLISSHREENVDSDKNLNKLVNILESI